jgi:hypothetical protein
MAAIHLVALRAYGLNLGLSSIIGQVGWHDLLQAQSVVVNPDFLEIKCAG